LIIAGHGYQNQVLKELTQTLKLENDVEFVGFVTQYENARLYAKSKYYISIPESDGTAVSLLEAM
jgi:glycosyltransferase involved in cell wall biosynthesis